MKKILISLFFAMICFIAARAQSVPQFGDWEVVCWDSANVVTPLQVRTSTRNTDGKLVYTFYRLNYSAGTLDTKKVVPSVGTIDFCGGAQQDSINISLNAIIDSLSNLITNTTQPQMCDCIYTLDMETTSITIPNNSQRPVWNYDKVVRRNCGGGDEEVFRQPISHINSTEFGKVNTFYTQNAALSNGGVIDSFRVNAANTGISNEVFWIYASPALVALHYPNLLASGLDTSQLRYNTATVATMNTAITTVVNYAITHWALLHTPILPTPTYDFQAKCNSSGKIEIRFFKYNNPSGPYIGLATNTTASKLYYRATASAAQSVITGVGFINAIDVSTESYVCPCDTTIYTTYNITTTAVNFADAFTKITVDASPNPALVGSLGQATCSQTCPGGEVGCIEICNTSDNPIPVQIIKDSTACPILNLCEFPLSLSATTGSIPSNYYHSVSITTSGTVIITATNGSSSTSATFSAGQTVNFSAKDCEYLQTSFSINATSGTATVATIR